CGESRSGSCGNAAWASSRAPSGSETSCGGWSSWYAPARHLRRANWPRSTNSKRSTRPSTRPNPQTPGAFPQTATILGSKMELRQQLEEALKGHNADYVEIRLEESHTTQLSYRGRELEEIGRTTNLGGCVRAAYKGGWGFVSFN